MFFQTLSRNNDVNGNPYRLILVYNDKGGVVEAYEARSSTPNIVRELQQRGLQELWSFHLTPSEYNDTRKNARVLAKLERAD
jgi:hypothetical protein